ncbi:unnamed protein product [Schistosoma curassoni]|nr:unnamed protein product [Schistosoma bovis]CAH8625795.1 unnamed protein product [Schistosoma curassoni]
MRFYITMNYWLLNGIFGHMLMIPTDPEEDDMYSKIHCAIRCEKKVEEEIVRALEIIVSKEWIKSGTSVEFEPIERNCSENNSINECLNVTTSNMKCFWSEKINMCINSNDKDSHKSNETNYRVQNVTSGMTEHNNTLHYLYIVIPIVVSFCVLCIGCIIWRWLYKRKKEQDF